MGHLGKQEPDIQSVILNNNTLASGQAIVFAEGVAISGVAGATLGNALAVIDPTTGEPAIWIYENGYFAFGTDDRTSFRQNGEQVDVWFKSTRVFYYNSTGINMGERRLDGVRRRISSATTDITPNTQDTGIHFNNAGATGLINMTLTQMVAGGHEYTMTRIADFPVRITPIDESILTPTGLLPSGRYIELAEVGASVTLVAAAGGTWMTIAQVGTVDPEVF